MPVNMISGSEKNAISKFEDIFNLFWKIRHQYFNIFAFTFFYFYVDSQKRQFFYYPSPF